MDSDAEGCASDAFNYFKARAAMRCRCCVRLLLLLLLPLLRLPR